MNDGTTCASRTLARAALLFAVPLLHPFSVGSVFDPGATDGPVGRYCTPTRWTATATDPDTGPEGSPITLTWSFVPDGTWVEGWESSDLFAVFDSAWGSSAWMTKIRAAIERWDEVLGIVFLEVSDDGSPIPGSPGVLEARGDVRIAGCSIDGPGNVLAYAYYPNLGDIVLDTDDIDFYRVPTGNYASLKNTIAHGIGHAIGLGTSYPADCTKLMENFLCGGSFLGPQDDDIRGGQRLYGDVCEDNDTKETAADLDFVTESMLDEGLSIDRGADADWYRLSPDRATPGRAAAGLLSVEVGPIGSCYFVGCTPDSSTWSWVCTDSVLDLDLFLYDSTGTVVLDSACSSGLGAPEAIDDFELPYLGDYLVKIVSKGDSGDDVQRYGLTVHAVLTGVTSRDPAIPPVLSGGLMTAPNPFNSSTAIRSVLPAAGRAILAIYDSGGRRVTVLSDGHREPGEFTILWEGTDPTGHEVPSGIYYVRLRAGGFTAIRKMVLLR
jgi:hypothetical protein